MEEENKFEILEPGILLEDDDEKYQDLVKQLDELKDRMVLNSRHDFIGAHPVSMTEKRLHEVWTNQTNYLICEKTDGVRYIMLIMSSGQVYLTGRKTGAGGVRKLQFFQVNIVLPFSMFQDESHEILFAFDGELCEEQYVHIEQSREKREKKVKYLIFDTIFANNNDVFNEDYITRLKYAEYFKKQKKFYKDIQKQMGEKAKQNYSTKDFQNIVKNEEPISIIVKDFYFFESAEYLLKYYIQNLPHKNDGLIFTKIDDAPYKPGTCNYIIKWKPPHMNSIDFLVVPNQSLEDFSLVDLYVFDGEKPVFFDYMAVSEKFKMVLEENLEFLREKDQPDAIGVVCECTYSKKARKAYEKLKEVYLFDFEELVMYSSLMEGQQLDEVEEDEMKKMKNLYEKNKALRGKQPGFGWKFDKFRMDKSTPNNYYISLNIIQTLEENITEQKIIDMCNDKSFQMQYRHMQQYQQQPQQNNNNRRANPNGGQGGTPTKKRQPLN